MIIGIVLWYRTLLMDKITRRTESKEYHKGIPDFVIPLRVR